VNDVQGHFKLVKALVGGYLALSVATLGVIVALRNHPTVVNPGVWIRGSIVVASAAVMVAFAVRAARGSAAAYKRLRIVSAAMVVAITVIIAIPGSFPIWFKFEQGLCGLLLVGVVVAVNGKRVRAAFGK